MRCSFSDWKIHVSVKRTECSQSLCASVDTYHVHRNILAIGERRSAYFANLFHYGVDDGDQCTRVELSSRAAAYFPELLDYIYSSQAFSIATRNAVALLFLAQAFKVSSIRSQVQAFIESDVRLNNFGYYMSEAIHFSDDMVALKVMDACGSEVLQMCFDSSLSRILRSSFAASVSKAEETFLSTWDLFARFPRAALRCRIGKITALNMKLSKGRTTRQSTKCEDGLLHHGSVVTESSDNSNMGFL